MTHPRIKIGNSDIKQRELRVLRGIFPTSVYLLDSAAGKIKRPFHQVNGLCTYSAVSQSEDITIGPGKKKGFDPKPGFLQVGQQVLHDKELIG